MGERKPWVSNLITLSTLFFHFFHSRRLHIQLMRFLTSDYSELFCISALHDRRSELMLEQLVESHERGSVYPLNSRPTDEPAATCKKHGLIWKNSRTVIILSDFSHLCKTNELIAHRWTIFDNHTLFSLCAFSYTWLNDTEAPQVCVPTKGVRGNKSYGQRWKQRETKREREKKTSGHKRERGLPESADTSANIET